MVQAHLFNGGLQAAKKKRSADEAAAEDAPAPAPAPAPADAPKGKKARSQPPAEESRQTMTQFQTEKTEAMYDFADHLRMLCGTSFKVTIETINV